MSKMNVESLVTFSDGSQLIVSTYYTGEGRFSCELFVRVLQGEENYKLQSVSNLLLEARTCKEAQDSAYRFALDRFPDLANVIKAPPYLIWAGPTAALEPGLRGRRSA